MEEINNGENNEVDGTSSGVGDEFNSVFISTSLGTRLIVSASFSDTVLQLKEKIINEHSESFPELGKIKIKALKRKFKGLFYHMSNSMLLKNAFQGSTKCWFVSVDVSSIIQPNENLISYKPEASNQQALIPFAKTTSGDSSSHLARNSSNKIFDNCGPGNSCNEVQKNLDVEVKKVTADNCSRVCSEFNGGVDCKEQLGERHVVLETRTKHKEDDSRVEVNDNHCDNTLDGSIRSGVNKKLKSKENDRTAVSVFIKKGENVCIDEHSSGKTVAKSPEDIGMKNVDDCKSREKTKDSVLNCTLKIDVLSIDQHSSHNTIEEVPTDVEMVNPNARNAPIEDALNSIPALKKRKKKRNKSKHADSPEEDSNGISRRNDIVPKSSVFVEENNTAASTEKLITETPKDVDLVGDTSNKKNRKNKKRSSKNKEVVVVEPSSHNGKEERFEEEVETVAMNVDKENAENIANDADKASDVQLAVPYSTIGVDVMEQDVEPEKIKSVAPELGPENGSKGTKKSKKRPFTNLNETNSKENVVLSVVDDPVHDDDDTYINSPDKLKEQKELPHDRSTRKMVLEKCEPTVQDELDCQLAVNSANLVETNKIKEAGNSAGRKRLKKKAKKPVSAVAVSSSNYSASEPTHLDTLLVKANDGNDKIFSKGEEENLENEEFVQTNYGKEERDSHAKEKETEIFVQTNYGKEERDSHAKEKETEMDFAQEKITPKSAGVSTVKPRKKKETVRDSHVKEKERKMDISQVNVTDITPKGMVDPVANVVEKIKKSDMAVKSKKSTRVSLENGSGIQYHPKNPTDIEHQDAKMSNLRASKVLERKVIPGNNRPSVSKSSSKAMGEIVNMHEKSLLATRASIFRDQSSESCEISDNRTKAPSYNLLSSSDSEEERADSARGVDSRSGKNEPKTPHSQRIDMDMILRRSRKYKQAKLSAVLPHPEDIESQTVDFVPDSQPNY